MLSDKTNMKIRRISFILLIGSPVFLLISFLDERKNYEDLDLFKGELVGLREKSVGYKFRCSMVHTGQHTGKIHSMH